MTPLQPSYSRGFTMIELLVATSVVILVLAGIAAGVTFSIRNTTFSKEKVLSVRHAQESIEWLRNKRDSLGWNSFHQVLSTHGADFYFCLDTLPISYTEFANLSSLAEPIDTNNCNEIPNTTFTRGLHVQIITNNQINVAATVGWFNGSQYRTTTLNSSLQRWR